MPTIHDLVSSIIEQAQSIESMIGDDSDTGEITAMLRDIDGKLDVLATAIEDGEL